MAYKVTFRDGNGEEMVEAGGGIEVSSEGVFINTEVDDYPEFFCFYPHQAIQSVKRMGGGG